MEYIWQHLCIFLCSAAKFGFTALAVISSGMGLTGVVVNILGGLAGVFFFTLAGDAVKQWLVRKYPERFCRRFSKKTRFLVRVKKRFGLTGVALLTPAVLSIPVGVLFALTFTTSRFKVLTAMTGACLIWAGLFFIPYFALKFLF